MFYLHSLIFLRPIDDNIPECWQYLLYDGFEFSTSRTCIFLSFYFRHIYAMKNVNFHMNCCVHEIRSCPKNRPILRFHFWKNGRVRGDSPAMLHYVGCTFRYLHWFVMSDERLHGHTHSDTHILTFTISHRAGICHPLTMLPRPQFTRASRLVLM